MALSLSPLTTLLHSPLATRAYTLRLPPQLFASSACPPRSLQPCSAEFHAPLLARLVPSLSPRIATKSRYRALSLRQPGLRDPLRPASAGFASHRAPLSPVGWALFTKQTARHANALAPRHRPPALGTPPTALLPSPAVVAPTFQLRLCLEKLGSSNLHPGRGFLPRLRRFRRRVTPLTSHWARAVKRLDLLCAVKASADSVQPASSVHCPCCYAFFAPSSVVWSPQRTRR
jgi:hypothetical protein